MMQRMSQEHIEKISKRLAELRLGDTHNLIVALLMDMSVGSFGLHEEIAQEKATAIMKLITPAGTSGTQAHAALASEPGGGTGYLDLPIREAVAKCMRRPLNDMTAQDVAHKIVFDAFHGEGRSALYKEEFDLVAELGESIAKALTECKDSHQL